MLAFIHIKLAQNIFLRQRSKADFTAAGDIGSEIRTMGNPPVGQCNFFMAFKFNGFIRYFS